MSTTGAPLSVVPFGRAVRLCGARGSDDAEGSGQPQNDTEGYDINTAVLKAPWKTALDEREVDFHHEDGTSSRLPGFGGSLVGVGLYEGEAFTAFELPLRGEQLAVLEVEPPAEFEGGIADFDDQLDVDALRSARLAAEPTFVDLTVPKIDIVAEPLDYNEPNLGLGFSCEPYTLRPAFHGATVSIDHKGIEAVAATVSEDWNEGGGGPDVEAVLVVDRPFVFFVYDRVTEFVLYGGVYSPVPVGWEGIPSDFNLGRSPLAGTCAGSSGP